MKDDPSEAGVNSRRPLTPAASLAASPAALPVENLAERFEAEAAAVKARHEAEAELSRAQLAELSVLLTEGNERERALQGSLEVALARLATAEAAGARLNKEESTARAQLQQELESTRKSLDLRQAALDAVRAQANAQASELDSSQQQLRTAQKTIAMQVRAEEGLFPRLPATPGEACHVTTAPFVLVACVCRRPRLSLRARRGSRSSRATPLPPPPPPLDTRVGR